MKKRIIPGVFIIIFLWLALVLGDNPHFYKGRIGPGSQPELLWSKTIPGLQRVTENTGTVLKVSKGEEDRVMGLDYYGNLLWQDQGPPGVQYYWGDNYWGRVDLPTGIIEILDYQGRMAKKTRLVNRFNQLWLGPQGQIITTRSITTRDIFMDEQYGEIISIRDFKGELIWEKILEGQGLLEARPLSGQGSLLLSLVDLYPKTQSRMLLLAGEHRTLVDINKPALLLPVVPLEEEKSFAVAAGKEFFFYSSQGELLFNDSLAAPISGLFKAGEDKVILACYHGYVTGDTTTLYQVDTRGNVHWERDLPGAYARGRTRKDQKIIIQAGQTLYLLNKDGSVKAYYTLEGRPEVFLLTSAQFLVYDGSRLSAYRW